MEGAMMPATQPQDFERFGVVGVVRFDGESAALNATPPLESPVPDRPPDQRMCSACFPVRVVPISLRKPTIGLVGFGLPLGEQHHAASRRSTNPAREAITSQTDPHR
jgi:hypothetical protein